MISVFLSGDAIGALMDLKADGGEKRDLMLEFIDTDPLTSVVTYKDDRTEVTVYLRNEMHDNKNVVAQGVYRNDELTVISGFDMVLNMVYQAAEGICAYMSTNNLIHEYDGLDEESEGVLFETDENYVLSSRAVRGEERPDLICQTKDNKIILARPYRENRDLH